MSDLNQLTFTGRLGADVEVRSFQNGNRVASFRLAVSKQWTDKKTGEKKERTEWVSVSVFSDGLIGVCERFLRKGSRVLVQGEQQTRKWQDQSGNDRYSTECVLQGFDAKIVLLDGKPQGGTDGGSSDPSNMNGGGWDDDGDTPF
jgi:single-strand DNA-binding protein